MPSEFLKRQSHDLIRDISSLGSLPFYILILVFFEEVMDSNMFFRLLIGVLIIYAVVVVIRNIYFKNRPVKFSHHNFIEKLDAAAFPSLHAARTGLLSLSLINYFDNIILSIVILLLALGILYSRIYLKRHDAKDVIGGAVLGVLVYFAVYSFYNSSFFP